MGAAPSIITVPTSSIARDVECLKSLCPSRFRLDKPSFSNAAISADELLLDDTTTTVAVVTDSSIALTLVLVAVPVAAANRITANRVTFVLSEQELKSIIVRCEQLRILTKVHYNHTTTTTTTTTTSTSEPKEDSKSTTTNNNNNNTSTPIMAELTLPGGAGFALISSAMVATSATRLDLGLKLAASLTHSLPKGITRSNSSLGVVVGKATNANAASKTTTATTTTPQNNRTRPERRQSFGGRRSNSTTPRSSISTTPRSSNNTHHPSTARTLSPSPRQNGRHYPFGFGPPPTTTTISSNNSPFKQQHQQKPHSKSHLGFHNKVPNTTSSGVEALPLHDDSDRPVFPTLKFGSLHLNGKYKSDFVANSRIPIPIETELFVGHMIFLLRPNKTAANNNSTTAATNKGNAQGSHKTNDPATSSSPTDVDEEDSYWNERLFAHKNRRLVLQVQGKFKYEPKGPVYAGLEASQHLHLGRLPKGLAGLLLKWAQVSNPQLYYSFGNETEKAKVVVPAHTFFDRILVTPPGRAPPSIMDPFWKERPESIEYRKQQPQQQPQPLGGNNSMDHYHYYHHQEQQQQDEWAWNISDTYSMSFCTSNLDLPTWKLLHVPQLSGDLSLRALIGSSVLRFVMYENLTPPDKGTTHHLQQYLRYAYVVQCKYLGPPKSPSKLYNYSTDASSENNSDTIIDWVQMKPETEAETKPVISNNDTKENKVQNGDDEVREGEKGEEEKEEEALELKQTESDKFPMEERDYLVDDYYHFRLEEAKTNAPNQNDLRPKLSNEAFDSLSTIDTLCPAWIEMWASQGKYTRAYAFNVNERTVFRTPQSFRDLLGVGNYIAGDNISMTTMEQFCSPRTSDAERTRRLFGKMLESALAGKNGDNLKRILELYSSQFLRRRETSFPEKGAASSCETAGLVARALSDRHWVEEWAKITPKAISFAHPETRKVHFSINMDNVIAVRKLEEDEIPVFYNYFFVAVETLGRTTYIMFALENDRKQCYNAISEAVKQISLKRKESKSAKPHLYLNYPREEFLHKSSMWNCDQRLIMNGREMSFKAPPSSIGINALEIVQVALRKALDPDVEEDDNKLKAFLDCSSYLKDINVNAMKEEHRLAFFLNLFHLMVAHATLILGAPDSQTTLIKHFSCLAYQCSDDIFSISELEHCIIRAPMTPLAPSVPSTNAKVPPAINSRLLKATSPFRHIPPESFNFQTPTSTFCFALQKADFRINFALNCGSTSNPTEITIYMVEGLDEQLDGACKQYLHSNVTIKKRNNQHVCMLPRVCQWYAGDFGSSNYSVIKTLEPYLGHHERKILVSAEFTNFPISLKYLPFSFECRQLALKDESFPPLQTESFETESASVSASSSSAASASASGSVSLSLPMNLSDIPLTGREDVDMDSLLDFLMDDALAI